MPLPQHSGDRTATGAGSALDYGAGSSLGTWVMTVTNAAADSVCALETSPDNTTWTRVGTVTGMKSCAVINAGLGARYGRINVIALGTNPPGGKVGAVISSA